MYACTASQTMIALGTAALAVQLPKAPSACISSVPIFGIGCLHCSRPANQTALHCLLHLCTGVLLVLHARRMQSFSISRTEA
jgi:hypothetical protein